MKTFSNNLGWTVLGAIVFLFVQSYLKKEGLGYLVSPSTFFVPFALAWASDSFFPKQGREVRDFIVGVCGAQWLSSLLKFLG